MRPWSDRFCPCNLSDLTSVFAPRGVSLFLRWLVFLFFWRGHPSILSTPTPVTPIRIPVGIIYWCPEKTEYWVRQFSEKKGKYMYSIRHMLHYNDQAWWIFIHAFVHWSNKVLRICQALHVKPNLSHLHTSAHLHALTHLINPTTLWVVIL